MFALEKLRQLGFSIPVLLGATGHAAAGPAELSPSVVIESFTAGGRAQVLTPQPATASVRARSGAALLNSYAGIRLPVRAQALDFRIGPNLEADHEPGRIQFRLEGWDEEWQDVEGIMWLSVRFLDESGRRISSASLPRTGQSMGWTGDPDTSPFRSYSETVVPPPRTRRLQVFLSSGGASRTTGVWLVKSLRILIPAGKERPEKVLLEESVERGDELQKPQGAPLNWRRDGTNTSAPQVFTFSSPAQGHALALIDSDIRSAGRWTAQGSNIVEIEPGIPVRIETEEAFSIGGGGNYTCSYYKLPAGRYVFRAIPVDEFGVQAGVGVQVPITLVPPVHAAWWFWAIIGLAGVAGLTGGVRYATWKRLQREIEKSERQHAVEKERTRIARDIHDDMGARLTQISLVSSIALRKTPPDSPTHGELKRMDRAAREVVTALDEIVWAVNPAHDTLEGLGNYLSQYVTEALAAGEIRCRLEIPTLLPARFISSGTRHQLFMTVKEALNNAIKHSGASEILVRLGFAEKSLTISIADNGRGFEPQQPATRNGIANMNQRLRAVGGTCEIQSTPGHGTTVIFRVDLDLESPTR